MRETIESAWQQVEETPERMREKILTMPRMPVEIVACPLGKEVNYGGILRIAEAFRIEMVSFEHEPDHANDFSGNRGSTRWQPYRWIAAQDALNQKPEAYKVALTLSDNAVDFAYHDYKFPLVLIVGSEMTGVPKPIAEQCDVCVGIPMFGLMGSLNVATATAIVMQHIARQYGEETGFEPVRDESKRLLSGDR